MEPFVVTERTQVHRLPERAVYERDVVYQILDEALFCHVAHVEDGHPKVIPTIHVRVGDTLYIHGSNASHTLRALKAGTEACVAVTLVDGLVLARSGFHSSMNYRSVMVYGTAREVIDPEEKLTAQAALVDHVVTGRSQDTDCRALLSSDRRRSWLSDSKKSRRRSEPAVRRTKSTITDCRYGPGSSRSASSPARR